MGGNGGGGIGKEHMSKLSSVSFYRGNNLTLMILSKPKYLPKDPIFKYNHIRGYDFSMWMGEGWHNSVHGTEVQRSYPAWSIK